LVKLLLSWTNFESLLLGLVAAPALIAPFHFCRALSTFRKETDDGDELELHGAEVAALMNLVATDTLVEEAVSLIPSLSRFPEAAIDEILDLIRSTMIRIVS
jgi:hypothetical protein